MKNVINFSVGTFVVMPYIDYCVRVDLRTVSFDVPPQEVLTKDSVTVSVDAIVYYRIKEPLSAVIKIANYRYWRWKYQSVIYFCSEIKRKERWQSEKILERRTLNFQFNWRKSTGLRYYLIIVDCAINLQFWSSFYFILTVLLPSLFLAARWKRSVQFFLWLHIASLPCCWHGI